MNRLAFLVTRIANASLDQYTRVAILEGVANVRPGTWGSRPDGLARAHAHLSVEMPGIDPVWFVRQDVGLYKAIYFGALGVTQSKEDAEDVAQNVLGGFSRSKDVEGGQLHDVGRRLVKLDDISIARAKGMLKKHGKDRALRRGLRPESLVTEDEDGAMVERDVASPPDQDEVISRLIEFLADPAGGNIYKIIRRELARAWADAPGKVDIFDAIVENPEASDTQIAKQTGTLWVTPWKPHHLAPNQQGFVDADGRLTPWPRWTRSDDGKVWLDENNKPPPKAKESATLVTRTRSEIKSLLPQIVAKQPGLLKNIHLQEEMSGLGYHGNRWARHAKNLILVLTTP